MVALSIQYGAAIGAVAFLWLVGEYLGGLHTKHFDLFYIITNFSMLIPMSGVWLYYRRLNKNGVQFGSFGKAIVFGILTSLVAGVVAGIGQAIYHLLIHPAYFNIMIELSKQRGNRGAESFFTLQNYVLSTFGMNFIVGLITVLIIVPILRRRIIFTAKA